ncbi:MAG: Flp pilus assembly protein CpaB [Bacillota bacterium]|nr:Flp pilus assembly protein CpaB [Bacillota bacterium]
MRSLALAFFCALLAAGLAFLLVHREAKKWQKETRLEQVVVAATDLPAGHLLQKGDLMVRLMPPEFILPGALSQSEAALGSHLAWPVLAQEQIVEAKLRRGKGGMLGGALQPGWRAMTIGVEGDPALRPLISPGDRIDLIVVSPGEESGESRALTFLQNVPILAVNGETAGESRSRASSEIGFDPVQLSLTLGVTPPQAQLVALAQEYGRIRFALRSAQDEEMTFPLKPTSWKEVIPRAETKPASLPAPKMRIFRGVRVEAVSVQMEGRGEGR